MENRNIPLFLIPMPFCTFCAFFGLLSFAYESSCMPSFLNFHSGSSIHSVLLCERCIQLSAHGQRRTFGNLVLIWFSTLFRYILLSQERLTLICLWHSILGMGSFIYNIMFTLLPFHEPFAVTPQDIFKCEMDGASKQYSRPFDSSLLSRTSMCSQPFGKTTKIEEILSEKQ